MAQSCVFRAQPDFYQLIAVEVNKRDLVSDEFFSKPGFIKYKLCVPLVAGAFSGGDRTSTEPSEALCGGTHQMGMRIDSDSRHEVHEIWL
jgi:hypothetical protein